MAKMKDMAEGYQTVEMGNITELEKVSVDVDVVEKVFKEGTDDEFRVLVVNVDGKDYRVPKTVLKQLKVILEAKPQLKHFRVNSSGKGMSTEYTIITLD